MNQNLFFYSLLQIFTLICIGYGIIGLSYKIVKYLIRTKLDALPDQNLSFGILTSGVLFSVGNMLLTATLPTQNMIKLLKNTSWIESIKLSILFLLISLILAGLVIYLTLILYSYITKKSSILQELKENNLSIAIITTTIIIIVTLFAKEGLANLLESLIPYPSIPNYF